MKLEIPYGKGKVCAELPEGYAVEVVLPRAQPAAEDPAAAAMAAVYKPLGDVKPPRAGQTVAIAINDKTRPVPHEHLLPPVLAGMRHAGVRDEDVLFIIATGVHPQMAPEEYRAILPEDVLETYRVVCHDAADEAKLSHLGETARGTPVFINSDYMAADYRIAIGNIEAHQFQGFSGGAKSAAIGLAGARTINRNHAMMSHPMAKLGTYEENPARQDVEEIGRMIGIDFAVNAILSPEKRIITALAGDPEAIMRQGIAEVRRIAQAPVAAPFDLMIASPGGHPKDINIYQSQKGLAHAASVTRSGGALILCAACPGGSGSADYESWMMQPGIRSHQDVLEMFAREEFRVGRHKAFQVSRDAARVRATLVSELDDEFVRKLLLEPGADLQSAIHRALAELPREARIGVMPAASATMPVLSAEGIR
ncbi:MAG: nickel-dependent lactate racemase [Chloroflexi bacterium]|nr:nickel-dependent lactate racemase [Chloroflexota bacterium]